MLGDSPENNGQASRVYEKRRVRAFGCHLAALGYRIYAGAKTVAIVL